MGVSVEVGEVLGERKGVKVREKKHRGEAEEVHSCDQQGAVELQLCPCVCVCVCVGEAYSLVSFPFTSSLLGMLVYSRHTVVTFDSSTSRPLIDPMNMNMRRGGTYCVCECVQMCVCVCVCVCRPTH